MADQVRREVEVDTALGELYGRLSQVNEKLHSNKLMLAHYAGIRPEYVTRTHRDVRQSAEELAAMLAGMVADGKVRAYEERQAREALAKRETLLGERAAIHAAMSPLDAEFAAKPWSRFFLVNNRGGHIHSSMNCSTCFPTTQFGWLPNLSGLAEKDAVEAHGPMLCTVCYPSAPVEWTVGKVEVDPNQCPGSGTHDYDRATYRRFYTGNGSATCTHCEQRGVGVTSTGKLRKHKREVAS